VETKSPDPLDYLQCKWEYLEGAELLTAKQNVHSREPSEGYEIARHTTIIFSENVLSAFNDPYLKLLGRGDGP